MTGMSWEEIVTRTPGVARYISELLKDQGVFVLGWSISLITIGALPYRRGDRWAWYFS